MNLAIDASWAAGFLFGLARMGGFVVASPIYSKSLPVIGRFAMTLALGLWMAKPVTGHITLGTIVTSTFVNVAVGLILAFVTGLVFHLFEVAGSALDLNAGLSMAQIFDPTSGSHAGVFGRLFRMVALAIFLVIGGDRMLIHGLGLSTNLVPLTGDISLAPGIGRMVVDSVGTFLLAGIELAAPALVALFLAEIALGIAARFAPQANVFLIGIPIKLLITLAVVGPLMLLFPAHVGNVAESMIRTMSSVLRLLGG
jgi:flagellar biosynthetic protein FliR